MLETPRSSRQIRYPAEDLSRYRYHTGAELRPLAPDEPCPILFRDLGPAALSRFLRGTLPRLCGPLSPMTYLRTASYLEPYTDHEATGRIIALRPLLLRPWYAGVPHVFISPVTTLEHISTLGFVPGNLDLGEVAQKAREMRSRDELREELGARAYDEEVASEIERLDALCAELAEAERLAEPLRKRLKARRTNERERAREEMARLGIEEDDLCAAWHHLPRDRRATLREALSMLARQNHAQAEDEAHGAAALR